jgi:site-specific recombinase XerD
MAKKRKPFYVAKERHAHIPVYRCRQTKADSTYWYFSVADVSGDKRKCKTFSDPQEAIAFADDIALALAREPELLAFTGVKRHVQNALEALEGTGLRIDRACQLVADALKLLAPEELPEACRFWRDHRPPGFSPKLVTEAADLFLAQNKSNVKARRFLTNTSYLNSFRKKFGNRFLHEVRALEIDDWSQANGWSKKTRNDVLNLLSQFYDWSIRRCFAVENEASNTKVKRAKLRGALDIGILTPAQAGDLLANSEDELKPFMSLWCFSGARKEEISKITWDQVRDGLAAGSIRLRADQAKPGRARSIPLAENLKNWLRAYQKAEGRVLPEKWHGRNDKHQIQRLDDLTQHLKRVCGFEWLGNSPRHSFASYHLKLHGDPSATAKEMGSSLVQLDRHYVSMNDSVTREAAERYFAIVPVKATNIVALELPAKDKKPDVAADVQAVPAKSL